MINKFPHIKCVDVNYCGHRNAACAYILRAPSKETMIIDTGTPRHYEEGLKKALKELNVKKEEVTTLLLTHHHLDHASGASLLSKIFPDMKIYAHQTTLQIICEPTRFKEHMQSFLKHKYDREIGNLMDPVPENRCVALDDNDTINFANYTEIKAIYTPGHCIDHLCFYDKKDSLVFTGDAFGCQYKEMNRPAYPCIFMFDSFQAEKSINKIINCGAKTGAQTHYGFINNLKEFGEKAKQWAKMVNDIAVNSKFPNLEFYYQYVKEFGKDFMNIRNIRGHYITNTLGLQTIREFTHGISDPRQYHLRNYIKYT